MPKHFWTAFLDIIYPKSCHICSKVLDKQVAAFDDHICAACFSSMEKSRDPMSCYAYKDSVRELIHKFKYENRPYLAKTLVRLMSDVLEERGEALFDDVDCLVPVPLHPARIREREYNQSALMAKGLSLTLRKPVFQALRRCKDTHPQVFLDPAQRKDNVRGAFSLRGPSVRDKNVLLIDDVVTTGATVAEAAEVLKKAGAKSVRVLSFAKG